MRDDMMDDDFDKFFNNELIPEDVKEMMREKGMADKSKKGGQKNKKKAHKKGDRRHGRRSHRDEPADYEDDELEFDGRKEAYRMFAPGLWDMAEKERMGRHYRHGRHHGPMVKAEKDATKSWPKMNAMCPVMLFFIFASIHQICRIKFLEKSLAKLEFLQKAKKLVKKTVKKQVVATQPAQVSVVASQPV